MEKATFAAGCFWHVQYTFDNVNGVISTIAGYSNGNGKANYENAEKQGFAEVVQIQFDEKIVSYKDLLKIFWNEHDPTSLNKQGQDIGKRYRSAIFYHDEKQKELAEKSKQSQQKKLKDKIVTEITQINNFCPAEEYHQKYLQKNNGKSN